LQKLGNHVSLKIGTRGSPLALAQANLASQALNALFDAPHQITVIHTQGDRDRQTPLAQSASQGVFVKELESALLSGEIDIAVHSLKDVPFVLAPGTTLAGFLPRENPQDALVARAGVRHWKDLPPGAKVGTGSPRRISQLLRLRADFEFVPIRGNVETRIRKVDSGELDCILLGCAGLNRLGYGSRISYEFPPSEMVPAAGQGIVAIQCLEDRHDLLRALQSISDPEAAEAAAKERALLASLGGGCQTPMGALWQHGKMWQF
jgi:hydroxymethylbilane synthase